jgi:hypothetical protein
MTAGMSCCAQIRDALEDPDVPLISTPKFREVGIRVLDGGNSNILLLSCSWCRNKLPESLRDAWFHELGIRNIDPYGKDIPAEFLDERWYETSQR